MQLNRNSFGGDVDLDSVYMASSNLDLIYEKQIFINLYYKDFKF